MDSLSCARSAPSHPVPIKDFNPTVDHVHVQIMKLGKLGSGKAAGPDGICAELLKAGGHVMACLFHPVVSRLVCSQVWPRPWKGGRIASLWKKKGDPFECDNSRGLLVSDSSSKIATGLIKDNLEPHSQQHLP